MIAPAIISVLPYVPLPRALTLAHKMFQCGNNGTETFYGTNQERPGGSKGNGVACGSTATPLGRLLSCLSCRNKKDTRRRHRNQR